MMSSKKDAQQKAQKNRGKEAKCERFLESVAIFLSYLLVIVFFPVAIFFSLAVVSEFQRVVIFRLGRLRPGGARGPGVVFFVPCIDYVLKVDLRTDSFNVPAQAILTRDSVTIKVDAIVYYKISDPIKAILNAKHPNRATEYLAQTTLRNIAGETMLAELLDSRDQLSLNILKAMTEATEDWGVKVERVEVKEIAMPKQLQRAMAAEQEAMRQSKAKIAAADGELQSSALLREASKTMAQNPISLQLRYLQTLNTVSADKNHTIVVPLPLDIIQKLMGKSSPAKLESVQTESSADDFKSQKDELSLERENDKSNDLSKYVQTEPRNLYLYTSDSFNASN